MANRKDFYFPSSDGTTQIHAVEWLPDGSPRGVYQIAHGVSEYALRYEPFAEFLTRKGLVVVANDHLGHGQSIAEGAAPVYFGETDGWTQVVDDMRALCVLVREEYPELPYILMGHSMGSFLARTYLIRYPGTVDAAIIMGTGQLSPAVITAGKRIAAAAAKKHGYDGFSSTVNSIAFGSYNRAFRPTRTDFDWLSVNEENVDSYIADPLCGGGATIGLFDQMLGGIRFNQKRGNLKRMRKDTPVLFLSGAEDPVGDMGRGVMRAYESFIRAGVRDAELKLYSGLRHEILNEKERERVHADIWAWVSRRL